VHHVCGSHCGVCFVLVWVYVYISLACLKMHYGVRVLHLQHRHVFRRFHVKCMLVIRSNNLNAYSLHLHIYDRGAAMAKECNPDCFLPPPHRSLYLSYNQLVCVPLTTQARADFMRYYGPSTLCAKPTTNTSRPTTARWTCILLKKML
jgi:hypothetical protein